ncbi:MAG: DUF2959 family protein [Bryobacteraceae bacterium]|nr:DUF2959 family protein [Bryobacteraceae bacterium]
MMKSPSLVLAFTLLCTGCSSLYYAANEKIGREKRDILVSRVEAGRKDQAEAKEQFQNALEAFQSVTAFTGGKLEEIYNKLNKELERSEGRANDVGQSVRSIEKVAADLFREWDKEISAMSSGDLRTRSRAMRVETETRYDALIRKMHDSERKMKPVLQAFRDQVLFLKHNLNARAISSLKSNVVKIDREVTQLVKDIEASIAESDAFIKTMGSDGE